MSVWTWRFESSFAPSDQGREINAPAITSFNSFGQLIELHIKNMREIGKPLGSSEEYVFRTLRNIIIIYDLRLSVIEVAR